MKKKSMKASVLTVLISLVFVSSLAGCSFMGITIVPPKIYLGSEGQTEIMKEAEPVVEKPALEEKKESDQEILASFDEAVSNVADKVLPSVVNIKVKVDQKDFFGNTYEGEGVGSGVIYSTEGYIITNSHVAGNTKELIVTLSDGTECAASLIGADKDRDIAVIKIDKTGLIPAEFTSLDYVKVGEMALAIGSPFGLQETVTVGVISAIGRDLTISYDQLPMIDLIQTDAAINPGNSGGALVNSAGQILGINTMIYSTSGSSAGIGFAIPSDIALNVAEQIINNGEAMIPYMGIEIDENTSETKGVYVANVTDGYPAAKSGIKAGDIITAIDDKDIVSAFDLLAQILRHEPGDNISISIDRNGQTISISLTLVEKPGQLNG